MQSLLVERATGRLRPLDFATTVNESLYSTLKPVTPNIFPDNCHQNGAVNSLAIEATGYKFMLSGGADSSIKIWDLHEFTEKSEAYDSSAADAPSHTCVENNEKEQPGPTFPRLSPIVSVQRRAAHKYGVSAVKWWPLDTGMFISASFDHTVKIWDTNAVEVVHAFDLGSRVYAMDISACQTNQYSAQALIAVASDQPFIRLLDLRSAASAHTLSGHKGKTLSVSWHPQTAYLLASGGHDGEAKIWDIRMSKSCVARLDMSKTNIRSASVDSLNLGTSSVKAHSGPVNALVWDELGHVLFTAGNDDKVRVWDMTSSNAPPINKLVNFGPLTRNKYLQTLPLVLSPKNETEVQHLMFASDNGDVLIFRALDGKLVSRLQRSGSNSTARTAAIAYAGPFTSMYYCGTMDGEILPWRAQRSLRQVHSVGPYASEACQVKPEDFKDASVRKQDLYDDPYFKYDLQ